MDAKSLMLNKAIIETQMSQGTNKIGQVISVIISLIFLIISLFAFIFNWVTGLICLAVSAIFFGISKLSKYGAKANERTIQKMQEMQNEESPHIIS